MKRIVVPTVGLIALIGIAALAAHAATSPPTNLKQVGDHWTAWDPPQAGPDAYIIQKGDTLWDLAGTWFGDPFLWPQIWDENRYVLDSHWIYPGDPLVVPGRPTVVPDDGPPPVAETTPPSQGEETTRPPAERAVALPPPLLPVASATDLYCTGFITQDAQEAGLQISASDEEGEIMGAGDVMFVNQGTAHGVRAGDTFAILRWTRTVYHPTTREALGTLVRRMGKARVLVAHENTSTTLIEMSCEDIVAGDVLVSWRNIPMPMMSEMPELDPFDAPPSGEANGHIVAARDGLGTVGAGHVIFTDLGQHTGVVPGDVLALYRERSGGLPRLILGQAVVLTVETETSTAKIVKSTRESEIGDFVEIWR
jgi:hypothetical protein